ncbi:MAG: hypothetical protein ACI837_000372 [Crocinitomicaceae bacterium]|jgi:hypothetical protein
MEFIDKIFSIKSAKDFERSALEVFHYQAEHCAVYREYIQQLNWKTPTNIAEIPFLPISFFKTHLVQTNEFEPEIVFKSSGTGGARSTHYVKDLDIYERAFRSIYSQFIGPPEDQVILALLPNYIEQGESSLVYMVNDLIAQSGNSLSGFMLDDLSEINIRVRAAKALGKKVVLFGVSYALLDLCELNPDLSDAVVIETGGMKGRRKELTKQELHAALKIGLNCEQISSEYGMTELLSQAYSNQNGIFELCPWMHIQLRDISDPFSATPNEKTGGINIIDLANVHSCAFIATDDLGKISEQGFELMGRFDQAEIRGCNQLIL